MWNAFGPTTFILLATFLDKLALTMSLSLVEVTYEGVSTDESLFAFALRDARMPVTIVRLPIIHDHLSFAVALAILEVALVHVTIVHGQVTLTMGHRISIELSLVYISVCGCNFFHFCHLSVSEIGRAHV